MFFSSFLCLFLSQFPQLSISRFVSVYVSLSLSLSFSMYLCIHIFLSLSLSLSVCMYVCMCSCMRVTRVCVSVSLHVYLPVCLSVYQYKKVWRALAYNLSFPQYRSMPRNTRASPQELYLWYKRDPQPTAVFYLQGMR